MASGVVARVFENRGFGFISPAAGGGELFFHCRDLREGLAWDSQLTQRRVEFDVQPSPKGQCAVNIRPAA